MEKPNFEALVKNISTEEWDYDLAIAGTSPSGIFSCGKEDVIELLDHVWNDCVVPLESENKAIREENLRLQNRVSSLENICEMDRKTEYQYNQLYKEKEDLRDHIESCEQDNKLLREENTRLTTKFIEEEHAADHPNENLSYWQYQQFTRAAITKLREEISQLKAKLNV